MTRRRLLRDLESDLREHIELETQENIGRGMPPAEARLAALRKFGNAGRFAEETRAVWTWGWTERLLQDVRYAARGLRRNPLFATVAILTLALGIGMNTAVFSVLSAVLIKPLPYPGSERILWLANYNQRFHFEASSAPEFSDWREQAQSYEAMAGYLTVDSTILDGDRSEKHAFVAITPEFWRIAGARAARGRLFGENDRDVLVLSWNLFQNQFGGDPRAIGRSIQVDGRQTRIIGVLPRDFRFLPPSDMAGGMTGKAEAFTPFIITPEQRSGGRGMLITFVVAKLKPGVTVARARAEMVAIRARMGAANPAMRDFLAASELRVVPLREKLVGNSRKALLVLIAAVAFVLLIACANLGNLLLARASARQREIAIRSAIGAGRGRLLRHFVVEGLTLALIGGAAGVAVARGADWLLLRLTPAAIPRLDEVAIDWRVLLFTLAVSTFAGVIFGLAPGLSLSRRPLASVLKSGTGVSAGTAGMRMRGVLVVGELSLALVLLTGAGLMIKSFWRMNAHPASFEPEKIALLKVFLSGPAYRQPAASLSYAQRMLDRVAAIPGVQSVAVTSVVGSGAADLEGPPRFGRWQAPQVFTRAISADYRKVVGIPLIQGRWITDDEPAPAVVVNETFVRRIFGKENPIGQRVRLFGTATAPIVGVAGDLKMSRLDADPDPEVLISYRHVNYARRLDVLAKAASGSPAAILPELRKSIQELDPTQPPYGITTLEGALAESIAPRRFNLLLLASFAAAAVLLALIGIYGVMSYAVTQRTQEIGVRMALGASRGEIVGMVVRRGMLVALAGIAVGAAAALGLTRLIATMLYAVKPDDPWTFAVVAAALMLTALAAACVPAAKAARVDPLKALRYE